jgi:hypothetical protein
LVLALTKYFSSTENTAMDWCLPIVLKLGAKKTTRKGAYQLHFEEQFKSLDLIQRHGCFSMMMKNMQQLRGAIQITGPDPAT